TRDYLTSTWQTSCGILPMHPDYFPPVVRLHRRESQTGLRSGRFKAPSRHRRSQTKTPRVKQKHPGANRNTPRQTERPLVKQRQTNTQSLTDTKHVVKQTLAKRKNTVKQTQKKPTSTETPTVKHKPFTIKHKHPLSEAESLMLVKNSIVVMAQAADEKTSEGYT
ncbi:hypothetical protein BaRGS_00015850, partial [Batillaria attramentaria]